MSTNTYTLEEVKRHKVAKGEQKDVWIVLHDKVYDVSKFLDEVRLLDRMSFNVSIKQN